MQNEARITHIFGRVCAWGYNNTLLSVFAHHDGNKCLPWMADILPHLRLDAAATRQRHAVRPDRLGRVAPHGAGTLTSANRGSLGYGTGFGAKRFISRCLERDDSAAWNHLAGSEVELLPVMAASPYAGWGPTRAPDSGYDIASGRRSRPAPPDL